MKTIVSEKQQSLQQAADQICQWLEEHGKTHLLGVYGISLGGSIAFQMLSREHSQKKNLPL